MRVTTAKRKMTTNNAFLQSAKRASLIAALLACCSTAQSDELSSGLIDSAQLKSRHSANPAASFPQHAANSLQQHQAAAAQRARNLARASAARASAARASAARASAPVAGAGYLHQSPYAGRANDPVGNSAAVANGVVQSNPFLQPSAHGNSAAPADGRNSAVSGQPIPSQLPSPQSIGASPNAPIGAVQQNQFATAASLASQQADQQVSAQQPKSLAMLIRRQPDAQLKPVPQPQHTAVLSSHQAVMQNGLALATGQAEPSGQAAHSALAANPALMQSGHQSGGLTAPTVVPAGGPIDPPAPLKAGSNLDQADTAATETTSSATQTPSESNSDDESILQVADARDQQKSIKITEPIQFSLSDGSSVMQAAPTDHAPDGGVIREILPPRFGKHAKADAANTAPNTAPTAKPEPPDQSAASETEPLPFDLTPKHQPAAAPRVAVKRNVGSENMPAASSQSAGGTNQMIKVAKPKILQHGKTAYAGGNGVIQLAPGVDFAKPLPNDQPAMPSSTVEPQDAGQNAASPKMANEVSTAQEAETEPATAAEPMPTAGQKNAPAAPVADSTASKPENTATQSLSNLPIAKLLALPQFPIADLGLAPSTTPPAIQVSQPGAAAQGNRSIEPKVRSSRPTEVVTETPVAEQPAMSADREPDASAAKPGLPIAQGSMLPPPPPFSAGTNGRFAPPAAPPTSIAPAPPQHQPQDNQQDADVVRGTPRTASRSVVATPTAEGDSDDANDEAASAVAAESTLPPLPEMPAASADSKTAGEVSQEIKIAFAQPDAANRQVTKKHWVDSGESPVQAAPATVIATEPGASNASPAANPAQVNPAQVNPAQATPAQIKSTTQFNAFSMAANRVPSAPANPPTQQGTVPVPSAVATTGTDAKTDSVSSTDSVSGTDSAPQTVSTPAATPASQIALNDRVAETAAETSGVIAVPEPHAPATAQDAEPPTVQSADEPILPTATDHMAQPPGLESVHGVRNQRTVVADPPPAQLVGPVGPQVNAAPSAVSSATYDPASMEQPAGPTDPTPETSSTAPPLAAGLMESGPGPAAGDQIAQPNPAPKTVTKLRPAPTPRRIPGESKLVTVDAPVSGIDGKTANAIPIQLSRAQVRSMTIGGRLRQFKIDDDSICQVFHSGHNQIKLIGTSLGKTYLTVWADVAPDQTTRVQTFLIDVSQNVNALGEKVGIDTQLLNTSVARAFPGSRALVTQQNGVLIVSGTCPDDQMATQLLRMVRKSCRIPVIDRLSVQTP